MRAGRFTVAIVAIASVWLIGGPKALWAQSDARIRVAEQTKQAAPAAKGPKDAGKKAEPKKAASKQQSTAYAGIPIAERAAIQFDLNWTNHYPGLADGDFSDRAVAAVKAFQKDRGFAETGALTPKEREALATAAQNRRERVGWRMVEDRATGAQLGLPTKIATHESRVRSGTRWQTAQGQLQIETFRIREPGITLASVFEEQKKQPPGRQIATSAMRNSGFVLTGMQGLKHFLVRAEIRDLEIRGVTVLYDQAIDSTSDYIGLAVMSAFAPFSGTGAMALIEPPSRRRIEYGTGIVVTAAGHVVTDRQITEECSVLQIAGHGDASRIAERDGVSLLRIFGASPLTPAALVHQGAEATALTLVGIADPQAQGGERAVSTAAARLNSDRLDPAPQPGFAGAAAIDSRGRFFGLVTLKTPVPLNAAMPQATIAPVNTIRQLLDSQYVTPATGDAGVEAAMASVVRVICVRR
jgi:peptidoglycan hydrolase-like protein with peptidoglycan-binding domain